jgi:hypothetical protein
MQSALYDLDNTSCNAVWTLWPRQYKLGMQSVLHDLKTIQDAMQSALNDLDIQARKQSELHDLDNTSRNAVWTPRQ